MDAATGAPRAAALALGGAWAMTLAIQFIFGIPIATYIQLSTGNFLLTYVLIVADRVAAALRAALPARAGHLVAGDPALVVAGFQSLWYALATAVVFAVVMVARQWYTVSRLRVHEQAR